LIAERFPCYWSTVGVYSPFISPAAAVGGGEMQQMLPQEMGNQHHDGTHLAFFSTTTLSKNDHHGSALRWFTRSDQKVDRE
jgi:hypothetical protein